MHLSSATSGTYLKAIESKETKEGNNLCFFPAFQTPTPHTDSCPEVVHKTEYGENGMTIRKPTHELVRETQAVEEQFEKDGPGLLKRLADPDPAHDESNLIKLYAHSVAALGQNTDELIEAKAEKSA
jgi:hypothetical protein